MESTLSGKSSCDPISMLAMKGRLSSEASRLYAPHDNVIHPINDTLKGRVSSDPGLPYVPVYNIVYNPWHQLQIRVDAVATKYCVSLVDVKTAVAC